MSINTEIVEAKQYLKYFRSEKKARLSAFKKEYEKAKKAYIKEMTVFAKEYMMTASELKEEMTAANHELRIECDINTVDRLEFVYGVHEYMLEDMCEEVDCGYESMMEQAKLILAESESV